MKMIVFWNKGALNWTQYITLINFNMKTSERGTNDMRMYTPHVSCHIIMCFLNFNFVVKCDFQIKKSDDFWNFFFELYGKAFEKDP